MFRSCRDFAQPDFSDCWSWAFTHACVKVCMLVPSHMRFLCIVSYLCLCGKLRGVRWYVWKLSLTSASDWICHFYMWVMMHNTPPTPRNANNPDHDPQTYQTSASLRGRVWMRCQKEMRKDWTRSLIWSSFSLVFFSYVNIHELNMRTENCWPKAFTF